MIEMRTLILILILILEWRWSGDGGDAVQHHEPRIEGVEG
jgi:hypothetical protein